MKTVVHIVLDVPMPPAGEPAEKDYLVESLLSLLAGNSERLIELAVTTE